MFNPEHHIDVTGADLRVLVQTAYALSQPQGLGFIHATPGPLTDEEVDAILARDHDTWGLNMDYVKGRAVKMAVHRGPDGTRFIDNTWYDHSPDALETLVERIRETVPA
jgi:hypothetical protein